MRNFFPLSVAALLSQLLFVHLSEAKRPNILFLFNDDQDLVLGSLDYLDSVTKRIQDEGMCSHRAHLEWY